LRVNILKLLPLSLIILGIIFLLAVGPPATAAPPDTPREAIGHSVERDGITLEKQASTDSVPQGQVVSYTITIENDNNRTVDLALTDELPHGPEGLALQDKSIVVTGTVKTEGETIGSIEKANNTVGWTGSLAPGDQVTIVYDAIPPTTSTPGRSLENVAVLTFGETTLKAAATITTQPPELNLWHSFINFIAVVLLAINGALRAVNVPFAFGFAIILFTVAVRLATFPLNMQQIKSSKAMQELQPKMKELQEKYKGDKEKLAQAQMALYKEHGVNPLGGCLPMLVQMPIWFALYRSLIQLSSQGLLSERFLWIPNLAGPVSSFGQGIGWLYPFPPEVGWGNAAAYLVMPVLLVVSQFYTQKLMTPPSTDPNQAQMQSVMKFMPLMFGYFSLVVPSGLTLYWFTSNILQVAQTYFTKTQMDSAPATTRASLSSSSSSVAAPAPANPVPVSSADEGSENKKRKNVKSKRKSKRKR